MQQKYIAIGVVVVLALAAIGGGIALVANSNDDNNDIKIPDVSGKWNLEYMEVAKLSDEHEDPITDASQIVITDHHINPFETNVYLEINKKGNHAFTGKFSGKTVHDIAGTLNGHVFKFVVEKDDNHQFVFEGAAREGHISCTMTVLYKDGTKAVTCAIAYMLFIPDGGKPVPVRSDYFNMGILRINETFKSTVHQVTDFTGGKEGKGDELDASVQFVKAHNMISIVNMVRDGSVVAVEAIVSMGITPSGTVSGVLAGNVKSPFDYSNWPVVGNIVVAHGKALFTNFHHPASTGEGPHFIEIECNVPYYKGGNLFPVCISEEHDYKGTITIKAEGKDPVSSEITKRFQVYDNTFYSESIKDGKKIIWFGEIYGHSLDLIVMDSSYKEIGRISGHLDQQGMFHLFGVVVNVETGSKVFLDISLELVK